VRRQNFDRRRADRLFCGRPGDVQTVGRYSYSTVSTWTRRTSRLLEPRRVCERRRELRPDNAHQANANIITRQPAALRSSLATILNFNTVTKIYTESTNTPTKHSPILAWTADGYPVYGPYGYSVSNATPAANPPMISGYILRNGTFARAILPRTGAKQFPHGRPIFQRQLQSSRSERNRRFSARSLHGG